MSMSGQVSVQAPSFNSFGYISQVKFLGHMLILGYIFWEAVILFSIVATLFYIPISNAQGSNFNVSSPTLVIFCLFNKTILVNVEWYFILVFDLHFHNGWWYWPGIMSGAYWRIVYHILWRNVHLNPLSIWGEVLFGVMNSGIHYWWWLHKFVNLLKPTELYI